MNSFWSIFVSIIVLGNIIGFSLLLYYMRKMPKDDVASGEKRDHVFDGIEEYNNPLPRWWMWLFFICNIFALIYLVLYPGLGAYRGVLGWSQVSQWHEQKQEADATYAPIFAKYAQVPIPELAQDKTAMQIGKRIFINQCSVCHGLNAQGAKGFPNLTTNVWLFGGKPEDLKNTIANGRIGLMPPMGMAIGGEPVITDVANYVLSLSGQDHDAEKAKNGEAKFKAVCSACHGQDGTGNKMLGAPDLTKNIWIFGGTLEDIKETIREGRRAQMPAHRAILGDDKVHLVAAYVYSLANKVKPKEDTTDEAQ